MAHGDVRELLPVAALPHTSVAPVCQSLFVPPSGGSRLALVLPLLSRVSLCVSPSVVCITWFFTVFVCSVSYWGEGKGEVCRCRYFF